MTIPDPFASTTAPADEGQQTGSGPEPTYGIKKPATDTDKLIQALRPQSEDKISITFKGGRDFDAPWIVPKYGGVREALLDLGVNPDEVASMSPSLQWAALFERVQKMGETFAGAKPVNPNKPAAATPQRQAPQGATEPPSWFPAPPAPDWVYKTGFKNGSTWHAWAPAEKGGGDWQFHRQPK